MTTESLQIIPIERIKDRIYLVRNNKVMLDSDLARLYGVEKACWFIRWILRPRPFGQVHRDTIATRSLMCSEPAAVRRLS